MKIGMFLCSFVAAGFARPEAGYSYGDPVLSNILQSTIPAVNDGLESQLYNIQKSVYVYTPPEVEETTASYRFNFAPTPRRNTKIIFIKAPAYGGIVPEVVAPPSQAKDKIVIYILSKKQEGGSITIPASADVKQTKPEVYFIKYKSQHDVKSAVSQGLAGQSVGTSLEDLGNAQIFSRKIGDSTLSTKYGPPNGSEPDKK